MYWDDHGAPHFHARYGEYRAKMEIDSLTIVAGSLPRRKLRPVRKWAAEHRAELEENWERARRRETLRQIEPLA